MPRICAKGSIKKEITTVIIGLQSLATWCLFEMSVGFVNITEIFLKITFKRSSKKLIAYPGYSKYYSSS